jgi:ketosteroid isomerase-like protein
MTPPGAAPTRLEGRAVIGRHFGGAASGPLELRARVLRVRDGLIAGSRDYHDHPGLARAMAP